MITAMLILSIGLLDAARVLSARFAPLARWAILLAVPVIVLIAGVGTLGLSPGVGVAGLAASWLWALALPQPDSTTAPSRFTLAVIALLPIGIGILALTREVTAVDGVLGEIYDRAAAPVLDGIGFRVVFTAIALIPFLIWTANLCIKTVLRAVEPASAAKTEILRGGRIIGPAERILLIILAFMGAPEIIVAIIAAKGIVRFPEISRGDGEDGGRARAAEVFLVGSLLSWLIAAGAVAVLHAQIAAG